MLQTLMKSVFDMFNQQMMTKNIKFHMLHSEDMPDMVISDDRRLKQVLINLISNSLKLTENGSITVQS